MRLPSPRALWGTTLLLLTALPLLGVNGAPSTPARPPTAEVESSTHPLLDLLSFVPNTPETRTLLTFGDVDAWYAGAGYTRPGSLQEVDTLPDVEREQFMYMLTTQTQPPDALGVTYMFAADLRAHAGFNFLDAAQMLQAGSPPDLVAVLNVHAEPAQMADVLTSSGYAATQANGATLYPRLEDYQLDIAEGSPLTRLGQLNRVALIEEQADPATVLIGRATAPIEAALAAHAGEVLSLAGDPLYRFVAESLTGGAFADLGALVGLILVEPPPDDPAVALGLEGDTLQAQFEAYRREPMPPTLLHAFATFRNGADSALLLFAVLPTNYPADAGEAAAALLYQRLGSYISVRTGATLDRWTTEAYGALHTEALSAAYVSLRLTGEPENRFNWMQLIAARDLLFLTPGTAP